MRFSALVMAILLVATPALPQSPPAQDTTIDARDIEGAVTEAAETLREVVDLMRQPGLHPELLELFEIADLSEDARSAAPTPALTTTHWVGIGFAIGLVVLVLIIAAANCGFGNC